MRVPVFLLLCITIVIADNTHFETEAAKPGVVMAVGFRSDAEIGMYSQGGPPNDCVSYDLVEDAAKAVFSGGSSDLCTQVRPYFGDQLTQPGDELWVQWEAKWVGWEGDLGGLNTHKAFQIADGSIKDIVGAGDIKFEIRSSYDRSDNTAVGTPTFRVYQGANTDGDNDGDLRDYTCPYGNYGNRQPGGDTWYDGHNGDFGVDDFLNNMDLEYCDPDYDNPFVYVPNTWIRFTVRLVKVSAEERATVWIQDENHAPVVVLGSINNDGTGYKVDYPTDDGFNQFWFEFDSSQEDMSSGERYIYFRNLIVSTEVIAFGGLEPSPTGYTCTINGGTCQPSQCSAYSDCASLSETCSSGYCCTGTCAIQSSGDIYVSTTGSDSASGTQSDPVRTIGEGLSRAGTGDTVVVRSGTYNEQISFSTSGITLQALPGETVTVRYSGTVLSLNQPNTVVEGITFDGNWAADDAVRISASADNSILRNIEVMQSSRDCVDIDSPTGLLIEDSVIHDCINFPSGTRSDAHGIVTLGAQDFTVRDTEIYYVSGDAIQLQYDGWDNVLVEDCKLWNGPLPSTRGGAPAGANPGEDGIDTKYYEADGRGTLTMRNITAYGWDGDYVSNGAAFNLKHNIQATIDGVTCHDNEICFRVRGPGGENGGAWATIINALIHDNNRAFRYEDSVENLKIYNNIFASNGQALESAGGYGSGFDMRNNVFLGSKPSLASDSSNVAVSSSDFVNGYYPSATSPAIDAGDTISLVTADRDGNFRSVPYDSGAYEYGQSYHPADENRDNNVDISELIRYINMWKSGTVSIAQVMSAITEWKN